MSSGSGRQISRRDMIRRGIAGAAGLAGSELTSGGLREASAQTHRRPNVIVFHTDDQDFNTIGCYGAEVMTPHFDSIANTGVLFSRGYVTTGVCMASRYALITGQFPSRCMHPRFLSEFPKNVPTEPAFNTPLAEGQDTIASVLQNAGYATGFVGKWNIGSEYIDPSQRQKVPVANVWANAWKECDDDLDVRDPKITAMLQHNHDLQREGIKRFGFDYAECITTNPESYSSRTLNYHNPEWITDGALDFINQNSEQPFFLYLNHTLHHIPHPQESLLNGDPRVTTSGYLDRVPDCMAPRREIYERVIREGFSPETAYCTWMDDALGAVLNRLGELNLTDDTLIMLISDNNVPGKATIYEGGVNVPCLMKYPRRVEGGRRTGSLTQNTDFAPTIFDVCGVEAPASMRIDGASIMPMLTGERDRVHDDLFFEIGWTRAVCTEQYKYLAVRLSERGEKRRVSKGGAFPWVYHGSALEPHQHHVLLWHPAFLYPDQLYDLNIDPNEVVNLSSNTDYNGVLDDMKGRMKRYCQSFDNPFGEFA